jgi:hypothetical protein
VNPDGNTAVGGTLGVTGAVSLNNVTESTNKDTGSLIVEGGVGIEKNLHVGGAATITGVTTVSDTTASTNKDTGALVVNGGLGVEGNINAGGNINAVGTLTVEGNTTLGNSLTDDAVTITAAATFAGKLIMTPSGETQIVAGTGITATHTQRAYLKVRSDGGAIDVTANPQIAAGTAGQMLTLQGTSDVNSLRLQNGNGLVMANATAFTIKEGHLIQFIFDGTLWRETFRTVPTL